MGVTLVVATVRRVEIDTATRGEFRQDMFARRPQLRRLHEGLVVEASGEEAADEAVGGFHVELQRRPHVLRRHGHTVRKPAMRGTHVGLVVDLHGRVWIPEVGGQHTAGRWYFVERPRMCSPLAKSAEAMVSPSKPWSFLPFQVNEIADERSITSPNGAGSR